VTHDNADFDAIASAVAATKLYPAAHIVLGKRLAPDVQPFMSLHKLHFPSYAATDIERDVGSVHRVILVDVRRAGRLGHLPRLRARILARNDPLDVHVWDHHRSAPDDVSTTFERVERVGSATTLLVEEIQKRGIAIDVPEATLFALGIHVDTGSLRYSGTTPRDAAAVTWLLGSGASLPVINRFIAPPFSAGQQRALVALLTAIRVQRVASTRIGLAQLPEGYAVDGLADVVEEALQLEDLQALFAAFALEDRAVQIVARAREPRVDVGAVLAAVGGGGHETAGAAVVHNSDTQTALNALLGALRAKTPTPALVEHIMSSPVHAVAADSSMATLAATLAAWGHTGAPVMKEGQLLGIVSRSNLASALSRGKQHESVSRHMSQSVKTIEVGATLDDALARMTACDIGRLPVMRAGRVVGIVTRSDVLQQLYKAH